jgi:dihydropteroate synthase
MRRNFLLRSRDKTLELGRKTRVMGILNVTPDSFYDGGRHFEEKDSIQHAEQLIREEVDIIDMGGQSTRPGSQPVGVQEELKRILPVLSSLRKKTDRWISIDTYRSEVARICLEEGADMINDVSSFRMDSQMASFIAKSGVPVVCMHFLDSIHPMPVNPSYQNLLGDILQFFRETFQMAESAGIQPDQMIVDPGIGFGKSLDHNLKIMKELYFLKELDKPVLVGPSRKSFLGKITGQDVENRLEGTAAAVGFCVERGAHIVRVHDAGFFRHYCDVLDKLMET